MKIKLPAVFLIVLFYTSCAGQSKNPSAPEPDFSIYESERIIEINKIIETKDGAGVNRMPNWFRSYLDGGINEVEKLEAYRNKYTFIGINEGANADVLNKWADNFSAFHDLPVLAAARIENRMIAAASLYPDDEYGPFFERMIKNAYSGEYPGAVKEDTYWIKYWFENEDTWEYTESYMFFVLITIDKNALQANIRNMMARTFSAVTVTNVQRNSINRLRQTFFQGF